MTDDERLYAHAEDLKTQAAARSMVTHTAFLDLHQRTVLQPLERLESREVQTFYYGGYPDAERTIAVFVPTFFAVEDFTAYADAQSDENPLCVLRLDKDRFHTLSHRDYLGAMMGLQIKRELLGDILTDDSGAFVLCLKKAAVFIKENLTSVGRASVRVRDAAVSDLPVTEQVVTARSAFVQSVRLDTVLAAAFSLSRTKAAAAISGGVVYVNSVQTLKPDLKLSVGDKLVLRGKGKAVLSEIGGESKKGRTHLVILRYN